MMFLLVLVCMLPFCNCLGTDEPEGGELKYVVNFDSPIYAFGDESQAFIDTSAICVERFNESTAFMHGDIVFLQGLEDKAILEIVIQKEASGKFETFLSYDICGLCKELGDEGSNYRKYLKYFGIPTKCPFDAGVYKINDFSLDMDEIEVSSQHAGRYEAQLNIYVQTGENCQTDKELKCTLKMDLIVEPE